MNSTQSQERKKVTLRQTINYLQIIRDNLKTKQAIIAKLLHLALNNLLDELKKL